MTFEPKRLIRRPIDWPQLAPRYLQPPSTITHGWRFWGVKDNRLLSPFSPLYEGVDAELSRDGVLDYAYFLPDAETMFERGVIGMMTHCWLQGIVWRDNALTFGVVEGPLTLDQDEAGAGSMRATRYHAKVILANNPERFQTNYDLPAIANNGLDTMLAVERDPQYLGDQTAQAPTTAKASTTLVDPPWADWLLILFVCSYNVGRSPMAAAMFAHQLNEWGYDGNVLKITSAGTAAHTWGSHIDARAARLLQNYGYPVPPHHRSTWVGENLAALLNADLIVVMEQQHAASLPQYGVDPNRIRLLRSFDPGCDADQSGLDIKNPYTDADFEYCFSLIEAALPGLRLWVNQQLDGRSKANKLATVGGGTGDPFSINEILKLHQANKLRLGRLA